MKQTLTALTIVATMFASSASAADPDDLQRLVDTNSCVECNLAITFLIAADLSRANLRGSDLYSAVLSNADMSRADLHGADLFGANLSGADLSGANLKDANLSYAYMNGAILCNTIMPDGSVIYSGC